MTQAFRWLTGAATAAVLAMMAPGTAVAQVAGPCEPQREVGDRVSPYDSAEVRLDGAVARICYGRPSLRGRTMIGGEAVPYDALWRTGANEPTILHLPVAAEVAGMALAPGSYSIYTVPREDGDWTVVLNGSTSHWGAERYYTGEVAAQEIGRAEVPTERLDEAIEQLTIRSEPLEDGGARIVVEWQHSRIFIPVRPTG